MTNGTTGQQYSHEELLAGLQDIEDLMDRLLTPFVLLGKTGECVRKQRLLEGENIEVGIRDKSLTQYVYDILKTYLNLEPEQIKSGFSYNARNGVPIKVVVYTKEYEFFKYADRVVYQFGFYDLPNPFDVYWEQRGDIS